MSESHIPWPLDCKRNLAWAYCFRNRWCTSFFFLDCLLTLLQGIKYNLESNNFFFFHNTWTSTVRYQITTFLIRICYRRNTQRATHSVWRMPYIVFILWWITELSCVILMPSRLFGLREVFRRKTSLWSIDSAYIVFHLFLLWNLDYCKLRHASSLVFPHAQYFINCFPHDERSTFFAATSHNKLLSSSYPAIRHEGEVLLYLIFWYYWMIMFYGQIHTMRITTYRWFYYSIQNLLF